MGRFSILSGLLLWMSASGIAQAAVCDVDADSDVDQLDIGAIFMARNTSAAGPGDPRDADGDGYISVNDASICVALCTLPGCPIVTPSANTPPVADAGNDQTVLTGDTVTLDGSGSSDADGDALNWSWTFVALPAGSAAALSDPSAVMPSFVADVDGQYVVELIVDDGEDGSAPDEVVIITAPGNTPPVADAGPDQTVALGDLVQLDGSGSFDVDADPLSYAWSFASLPAGSAAELSGATLVNPTFNADLPGQYELQLVVDDGIDPSAADSVIITTANSVPVADAGPNQTVTAATLVTLDGTASFDADGDPLTYSWSLTVVPAGSSASLSGANTANPTFVADLDGDYVAQLIVNDTLADSLPDTVAVTSTNTQPLADAGADQQAFVGDTVFLDGSASADADNGPLPLSYFWSFNATPAGSGVMLSDPFAVDPTFQPDVAGTYVLQLIVNDGLIDSLPDTTLITITVQPPLDGDGDGVSDDLDLCPGTPPGATVDADGCAASQLDGDGDGVTDDLDLCPGTPPGATVDANGCAASQLDGDGDGVSDDLDLCPGTPPGATVDPNGCVAPTISSTPVTSAMEGETYQYDVDAIDPDPGDVLTFSLDLAPAGMTIDPASGLVEWTPLEAQSGANAVTVRVTDSFSLSDTQDYSILVSANAAPVVDAGADVSLLEGQAFAGAGSFADADSTAWTATVDYGDGAGPEALALIGNSFSLGHVYADDGSYAVTVTVTDDLGNAGTDVLTVTVNNVAPVVDAGPDAAIDEGATFAAAGSFTDPGADSWTATVDYGDGSGVQALSLAGNTFALNHVYADNGSYVVTVTVTDDDAEFGADSLTVTVNNVAPAVDAGPDVSINEDQSFTRTASFSDPGADSWTATVDYGDGTGVQPLLPAPGNTLVLDHGFPGPGTYTVTLSVTDDDGDSGSDTVTVTVAALPIVTLVASDAAAAEAGLDPGEFLLSRSGSTAAAIDVNLTFGGSGLNGVDYQTIGSPVQIPAGQASITIPLIPIDDGDIEGDDSIVLTVVAGSGYAVGSPASATVIIADDERPEVTIVASDAAAAEAGPDTGTFVLSRSGPTSSALLVVVSTSGTASSLSDYQSIQAGYVFASGESTLEITLTPLADNLVEADETVTLSLVASSEYAIGGSGSADVIIADDPPIVTLVTADAAAAEAGADPGSLTLSRSGGNIAVALPVQFTAGGSASNGADYQNIGGGIQIPADQPAVDIVITPLADNLVEGDETATLTLVASPGYLLGTATGGSVTISDDPTVITVIASDPNAAEAGPDTGEFTFTRSGGDLTDGFILNIDITGTATEIADYANMQSSFIFPANELSVTRLVTPLADALVEGDETVIVTIDDTATASYIAGTPASATVVIADNRAPAAVDDPAATDEDNAVDVDVLANDSDPDGDTLSVDSVTQGANGAVVNNGTNVTYTPAQDFNGSDSFTYTIDDGNGNSATATVNVTVNPVNDAPLADAGPDQANLLTTDVVQLDGSGSSDVDGDSLAFAWSLQSGPAGGTAGFSNAAIVNPTVAFDVPGTYVLVLTVDDGNLSATDTLSLTVAAAPTLSIADVSLPEGDTGTATALFSVTLSNAVDREVSVDFATADGSATSADNDYQAASGSLVFPANSTAPQTIPVTVNGDTGVEPDENFVVNLSNPVNATLADAQGQATIQNDDVAVPSIALSPATVSLLTSQAATLTVTLSQPAGAGGQLVSLASSAPTIATVPADVTVAAGATEVQFQVAAAAISGSASISAAAAGFTGGTAAVTVSDRTLTIALADPLVGVGRLIGGTVTLADPAPAGGVSVTLASSAPAVATVAPATVNIAEGQTSAAFEVTGITVGGSQISAAASGYATDSTPITVTGDQISIGSVPLVAPEQSVSLPISITTPTGGDLTINLVSSDPSIATVTPSVVIPGGAATPAVNPQITGQALGTVTITASAIGYAPDTRPVDVSIVLTLSPDTLTVAESTTGILTLGLSSPAPSAGLVVPLVVGDGAVAGAPAQVAVPAGQTSQPIAVSGVSIGVTTVATNLAGAVQDSSTIDVTPAPPITVGNRIIGRHLQESVTANLSQPAPPGGVVVTVNSLDPARLLVSNAVNQAGGASTTVTVPAGQSTLPFVYLQALDESGTVDFTFDAPGYSTGTGTATLQPSGFISLNQTISTNTFANNSAIQMRPARLHPVTLAYATAQRLRGGLSVDVTVTSSNPAVGIVANSPITFDGNVVGGGLAENGLFDPLGAGGTTLDIVTPAGFSTPSNLNSIAVTVTAPAINVSNQLVGVDLQSRANITLAAAPPAPVDITVTIDNPGVAVVSDDIGALGGNSVTFFNVTGTTVGAVYVQGLSLGTATLTTSAPGYATDTSSVTVDPSGFVSLTQFINTTTFAANFNAQIRPARLNPSTLAYATAQRVRGGLVVDVPITSSNPGVGTVINSPVTFDGTDPAGGLTASAVFDPVNAGSTILSVVAPAGFSTPSNLNSIAATVTAPPINFGNTEVGEDLQAPVSMSLGAAPPSPVDITVTVDDPGIAVVSSDVATPGSATINFTGVAGTGINTVYVQGLSLGATTITVTAPGYATRTASVTVQPSGFVISTPFSIDTNTFAANRSINVISARLNPSSLAYSTLQRVRAGVLVSVDVTSSNPGVAAIVSSPLVYDGNDPAQTSLVVATLDPLTAGATTVSLGVPAGFDTPSNQTSIPVTVSAPDINMPASLTVGEDMQLLAAVQLESAPPNPVDVVLTSTAPAIVTISDSATLAGGNTLTFGGVTAAAAGSIYVQGIAQGTAQIVAQAAGYNDAIIEVTVGPSGFVISSPASISTTAGAANRSVNVASALLDSTTLNFSRVQQLRAGISASVDVTSSNPGVGTITLSPVVLTGGGSTVAVTQFDPAAVGTTTISISVPPGFDVPSNLTSIPVTVN